MGLLSRKKSETSDKSLSHGGHLPDEKITKDDQKNFKIQSSNVHDPILDAVNEQQPFEQQQNINHQRMSSLSNMRGMKDIFGNPIQQADISNPTRARDERPMDTIRAFEYAITGDPTFRDQLETPHLGWRLRSGFAYEGGNNYQYQDPQQQQQQQQLGGQNPVMSFGGNSGQQEAFQQAVYTPPVPKLDEKKKKKGLFGKMKKSKS